mgnify:CR=1 FL=1|jgi:glutamyl-tRNA reductase
MNIFIISFNHKKCSIDFLGKINVTNSKIIEFYNLLPFDEKIILQTCNRREFILKSCGNKNYEEYFFDFLSNYFKINKYELIKKADIFYDIAAFKHLIRVASGIESAAIGENQIFFQLKNAVSFAVKNGFAKNYFNKIFMEIFRITKIIKRDTFISYGTLSIPKIAIKLLKENIDIENKKVLVIGTGETNKIIINELFKYNPQIILLANRTFEEAKKIAEIINGLAINFDKLKNYLIDVDVIFSATSAPHFILDKEKVGNVLNNKNKKVIIFDLAVPRDIDPNLASDNIKIFTIDDIKNIQDKNIQMKQKEIVKANKIIESEIEKLFTFV